MTLATKEPNLTYRALVEPLRPRKATAELSLDVDVATCQVLAALSDGWTLDADPFKVLIERNQKLADAPDEVIMESLTRQSVLLEALWLHFASRAAKEKRSDHASSLIKAALNCQRALAGVLGTVHHLSEETKDAQALDAD